MAPVNVNSPREGSKQAQVTEMLSANSRRDARRARRPAPIRWQGYDLPIEIDFLTLRAPASRRSLNASAKSASERASRL
jgi:hypothetical protein